MNDYTELPDGYAELLRQIKARIQTARTRVALAVNSELIMLYWQIGRDILERQKEQGWGSKVIEKLSSDLRKAFPEMKGFSIRNLKYMRAVAEANPDFQFVQQVVAQLPWGHNVRLTDRVKGAVEREWYMRKCIEAGWSRDVLVHQIESGLFQREGKSTTNFDQILPQPQSELAKQVFKDPYNFDFISLGEEAQERDLEQGLVGHLRDFLLELGVGFAFLGNQYHLEVGEKDYFLDLLFYHTRLHSYVVIELKTGDFEPEYVGKLNFYLSAVDDLLRQPEDNLSIGLLLCKDRNRVVAEYALRDLQKPIGVSQYQLTKALPEKLKGRLPTIEELEAELQIEE